MKQWTGLADRVNEEKIEWMMSLEAGPRSQDMLEFSLPCRQEHKNKNRRVSGAKKKGREENYGTKKWKMMIVAFEIRKTYFGACLGLRPSTMHGCPPVAQRLQVLAPSGKSHFICDINRRRMEQQASAMLQLNMLNHKLVAVAEYPIHAKSGM